MAEPLTLQLRAWARTFQSENAAEMSELLTQAANQLDAGRLDPDLASELAVCSVTRVDMPWQRSAAECMMHAAEILGHDDPVR